MLFYKVMKCYIPKDTDGLSSMHQDWLKWAKKVNLTPILIPKTLAFSFQYQKMSYHNGVCVC